MFVNAYEEDLTMAYEQYMKHSKNHRKDRFYQQCSGYSGKSLDELRAEEKTQEIKYFIIDKEDKIVDEADTYDEIISKGIKIADKMQYWIANSKMLMGRLDLYYS